MAKTLSESATSRSIVRQSRNSKISALEDALRIFLGIYNFFILDKENMYFLSDRSIQFAFIAQIFNYLPGL